MPLDPVFAPDFYVRQKRPPYIGVIYHALESLLDNNFVTSGYRYRYQGTWSMSRTFIQATTLVDLTGQPFGNYNWSTSGSETFNFNSYGVPYHPSYGGSVSEVRNEAAVKELPLLYNSEMRCEIDYLLSVSQLRSPDEISAAEWIDDADSYVQVEDCLLGLPCPINFGGGGALLPCDENDSSYGGPDYPETCTGDVFFKYVPIREDDTYLPESSDFEELLFKCSYDNMNPSFDYMSFNTHNRSTYASEGDNPYITGANKNKIVFPNYGNKVAMTSSSGAGINVIDSSGNRGQSFGACEYFIGSNQTITTNTVLQPWAEIQMEVEYFYMERTPTDVELATYDIDDWTDIEGLKPLNLVKGASNILALGRRVRFVAPSSMDIGLTSYQGTYNYADANAWQNSIASTYVEWNISDGFEPNGPLGEKQYDIQLSFPNQLFWFYGRNDTELTFNTDVGSP